MSEIIDAAKLLGHWPVVEGFFIIVITFLGIVTYRRGDRDRKALGPSAIEIPMFLLNGPVHDAMNALHNIAEEQRKVVGILQEIHRESREQTQLLEDIRNTSLLTPTPRARTR